jgi:DNA helicase HerA-like ATPase
LNIIDVETEYEQNMVIAEFIGLLYSMYDPGRIGILGPRFEQMMRNAMLVAMANEGTTLVDVMHIITNKDYLTRMLRAVKDPVVKTYWEELANNFKYERAEMLDYVTSKLNRFVGDIAVRGIVAQPQTTVDFAEIMNEGKILLVNLSKGKTGPEISRFLGLLVVPRLLITAFQRAHISEEERRPFFLYIDEFHNFTTPALATMLSEGRKYGLSLTLANQFISQLAPDIRESIFGNFGTMGVFQVGIRDAKLLEEEMYPVFDSDDLVNMPPYHVALKLPTAGTLSKPFLMQTRPSWAETHQPLAEAIRRHSRMIYGRDVAYNSAQIYRRFNDKD